MKFFLLSKLRHFLYTCFIGSITVWSFVLGAQAERVSNGIAVFSGLDKITGRTTSFEVYIGEVHQYGALHVIPRACYTDSKNKSIHITSFVEVYEETLDKQMRRIFTGWMFADSPGLNAMEHPVYDVWLKDCKQTFRNVPVQ